MVTGPGRSSAAPGPDAFRDPAGNSSRVVVDADVM